MEENQWLTLPRDLFPRILNHVKENDETGKDTVAFALTCKRFLAAYTQSSNTEFYTWYIRKRLREILSAQEKTRGTVMIFEMCAFIASYPALSPENKLALFRAIQTMLNVTIREDLFGRTHFVGDQTEFKNFQDLLYSSLQLPPYQTLQFSPAQKESIRQLYRCFHSCTSVFEQCQESHAVLMSPHSTDEWNTSKVHRSLYKNIGEFMVLGIYEALKTGSDENGYVPLRNAKRIVDLFIKILTPMNNQAKNTLIRSEVSKLINATETQSYYVTLNWLLDCYFEHAYKINPAVVLLPFVRSMYNHTIAEATHRTVLVAAIGSALVGFYSKPIRDVYRRLPDGYLGSVANSIRNTLFGCCKRRREITEITPQETAGLKLKSE